MVQTIWIGAGRRRAMNATALPLGIWPLSNSPSDAVTVCASPSRLATVTVEPGTTGVAANAKSLISICVVGPTCGPPADALVLGPPFRTRAPAVKAPAAAHTRSDPVSFMVEGYAPSCRSVRENRRASSS
jgi:hypothetical protein